MSNRALVLVSALILAGCSPNESDVEAAVKRHWPEEQKAAIEEAEFYNEHAAEFEKGEQLRKEVEQRLGKAGKLMQHGASMKSTDSYPLLIASGGSEMEYSSCVISEFSRSRFVAAGVCIGRSGEQS